MSEPRAPADYVDLRIAIAQIPMAWTIAENTESIIATLGTACTLAADIVLFPECAITGFHRGIRALLDRETLAAAMAEIQAACASLSIAAILGTPYFPDAVDAAPWNAVACIDALGVVVSVSPKVGLTESERLVFADGIRKERFRIKGISCSTVVCREIVDAPHADRWTAGDVDMLLWPGFITWRPADDRAASDYDEHACTMARRFGAIVVQANWPNSLNDPSVTGMGGSMVIGGDGALLYQCPFDQSGVFICDLRVPVRGSDVGDYPANAVAVLPPQ